MVRDQEKSAYRSDKMTISKWDIFFCSPFNKFGGGGGGKWCPSDAIKYYEKAFYPNKTPFLP